ncbi:aldehyde dehydrogenase family protein [Streptomyces sp. SYSU K217416]
MTSDNLPLMERIAAALILLYAQPVPATGTPTTRSQTPTDTTPLNGPLVHQGAVDLMDQRVPEAVSPGATVRTGGTHEGLVYQPTILTDVPYGATVSNEETFGPLVIVEAVDTAEEAVTVANRVKHHLLATLHLGSDAG